MRKNRLDNATSPYLLQHKDNPVHWYEWGEEVLLAARKENKPILLSVGYAACHWCHVMAHESFEDEETAALMNENFINIKVDREERPDIDGLYMEALHRLGERGGWPLTMFLTPEGKPFWGGTYFPKESRFGMPAFKDVLQELRRIYDEDRHKVDHNAKAILEDLAKAPEDLNAPDFNEMLLGTIAGKLIELIDREHGGIKSVPKFPQIPLFDFLWRAGLRYNDENMLNAVKLTLTHICQGGIYDHLGGGFARYSTDERWLVPHFEKMLYDNAQLLSLLSEVWKETQVPLFEERIRETVAWLFREMLTPSGAFAASLDADSEGVEGKFYVWSKGEIEQLLTDEEAELFCKVYDISEAGNWEGTNIPNRLKDFTSHDEAEQKLLERAKEKLIVSRETRVRPGLDDKVMADWNGLTIAALAKAGHALNEESWIKAARTAFDFIADHLLGAAEPKHSYRNNKMTAPAMATDYANMIMAALELYTVTQNMDYLNKATGWMLELEENFWDADSGFYYLASNTTRDLVLRLRSGADEATPNANGIMIQNLARLSRLTEERHYSDQAVRIMRCFTSDTLAQPVSHQSISSGALSLVTGMKIIVAIPAENETAKNMTRSITETLRHVSCPDVALQFLSFEEETYPVLNGLSVPELKAYKPVDGDITVYICTGQTCSSPVTNMDTLKEALLKNRSQSGGKMG